MPNRQEIKAILADRQLAPHKRLGQNFLTDEGVIAAILDRAAPAPEDTIVEFGVGLGSLTVPLARRVREVIGIEIDSGIVRWHQEEGRLPANVSLRHQDLLKTDLGRLARETGGRLKIISNLPYSISNPAIFLLIEHKETVDWAVLMLQREVAERLLAKPGTKAYGVLSVLLAACATLEPLLTLGPEHFHPRPQVDSTVIRIRFLNPGNGQEETPPALLKSIVKAAFQQRRKTLVNALGNADGGHSREDIRRYLDHAGIDETRRPDQLSPREYLTLTMAYLQDQSREGK